MAPLTRERADADHIPVPLAAEYYAQRASLPGTLIISEATFIAPQAGGYSHVPGIWNDAQIAGWQRVSPPYQCCFSTFVAQFYAASRCHVQQVTRAVHSEGSFIYLQLWALGRAANPELLEAEGNYPYVSASDVKLKGKPRPPRPLTTQGQLQLRLKVVRLSDPTIILQRSRNTCNCMLRPLRTPFALGLMAWKSMAPMATS